MRKEKREAAIKVVATFDGSQLGVYWLWRRGVMRTLWIGDAPDVTIACATDELPASRFPLLRCAGTGYKLLCPQAFLDGRLRLDEQELTLAALCTAGRATPSAEYPDVFEIDLDAGGIFTLSVGLLQLRIKISEAPRPLALAPAWNLRPQLPTAFIALFVMGVGALAAAMPANPTLLWDDPDMETETETHFARSSESQITGSMHISFIRDLDTLGPPTSSTGAEHIGNLIKQRTTPRARSAKAEPMEGSSQTASAPQERMSETLARLLGSKSVLGDAESTMAGISDGTSDSESDSGADLVGRGGRHLEDNPIATSGLNSISGTCGISYCTGSNLHGMFRGGMHGRRVGATVPSSVEGGSPSLIEGTAEISCATSFGCDKEMIRRVVRQHINEVRYCYERSLIRDPSIKGRVNIRFEIVPGGHVARSEAISSTLSDAAVNTCIASAVQRWVFPMPKRGGTIEVNYPFDLTTP